jgi:hypothetical protein
MPQRRATTIYRCSLSEARTAGCFLGSHQLPTKRVCNPGQDNNETSNHEDATANLGDKPSLISQHVIASQPHPGTDCHKTGKWRLCHLAPSRLLVQNPPQCAREACSASSFIADFASLNVSPAIVSNTQTGESQGESRPGEPYQSPPSPGPGSSGRQHALAQVGRLSGSLTYRVRVASLARLRSLGSH